MGFASGSTAYTPSNGDWGLGLSMNLGGSAEVDLISVRNNNTGGLNFMIGIVLQVVQKLY